MEKEGFALGDLPGRMEKKEGRLPLPAFNEGVWTGSANHASHA